LAGGGGQEQRCTEGEADGIDGTVGQHGGHRAREIGVGLGVVGFGGRSVPREVQWDDDPAGVGEQVDPSRFAPVALERRGEPVDQEDRKGGHSGRLPTARRGGLLSSGSRSGGPAGEPVGWEAVARRIDIELTSARPDGTWTWRAAGAMQPRGVVDGQLLHPGAKAGDVLRAEADFEIEGISIVSVLAPKEKKRAEPERIELIAPAVPTGVTTQLVGRGDRRPSDRRRDRDDGDSRGGRGRPAADRPSPDRPSPGRSAPGRSAPQ
jgi:hypothetical protein